jgi:SAM-dependent methyltransferase
VSEYDAIAELYDPWSTSVTEDVDFYVAEARKARGAIVELGVGTGRIAVPVAAAGVPVIGVDSSEGMLEVCRRRAQAAGVERLLDLRLGDLRDPPVEERVRLVMSPFRALLHLETNADRRAALAAAHSLLIPGGRFVFDVFAPGKEDVEETHGRWLEREPGIWERADWDLALLEDAGFEVVACYGWFDLRPYRGGEDSVWLARRPRPSPT